MIRSSLGLRIPSGMHDMLPDEIYVQDLAESKVLSLFQKWSYQKVLTPTLEYGACIQPDEGQEDAFYKFFDRQGHVLVLRPELTTPIARLVSTRLRAEELPLRICYSADVFRHTKAHWQEFRQAGVELIGSTSALADAETIALAVEALKSLGIQNFQFNLGHMGIFTGLLDELDLIAEFREQYQDAVGRKDYVLLERLVGDSGLPVNVQGILLKLPHLHGAEKMLAEVLEWSTNPGVIAAVDGLRQVYRYLQDFGVQDYVALDLGILRGFSYYTGVIFEGYIPNVGFPVVEGGRYDSLYEEFGYPLPATGFAINLGALTAHIPDVDRKETEIIICGSNLSSVIAETVEMRSAGYRTEMCLDVVNSREEAEDIAYKKKIQRVHFVKE